jgi:hypothetical protein
MFFKALSAKIRNVHKTMIQALFMDCLHPPKFASEPQQLQCCWNNPAAVRPTLPISTCSRHHANSTKPAYHTWIIDFTTPGSLTSSTPLSLIPQPEAPHCEPPSHPNLSSQAICPTTWCKGPVIVDQFHLFVWEINKFGRENFGICREVQK